MSAALVQACCRRSQQFDFPRGQALYYEGHASYGLFIVGAGLVRLTGEQLAEGDPVEAGPGSLLGVRELLTGVPHHATAVVASDQAKVCFIDKTAFLTMVAAQQPLAQSLLKAILKS